MNLIMVDRTNPTPHPCPHCSGTGVVTDCFQPVWKNEITNSLYEMAKKAGINEQLWSLARYESWSTNLILEPIRTAFYDMIGNPEKYLGKQPDSAQLACYDALGEFLRDLMHACTDHPGAALYRDP